MTKQRFLILALSAIGGLILAGLVAYVQMLPQKQAPAKGALIPVTADAFGAPFTLTNQDGKTVTDQDLGSGYRLIYFGFTFCPAICPTELSKMTATLNALGKKADVIQPVFITIDPERDTAEKMKSYISLFHPSFIGLTGTDAQIKKTLKDYKIYAAKVQDPSMNEYTMDHSSFIYFIAPDGRLLQIFKMQDDADMMTRDITRWMAQENAQL